MNPTSSATGDLVAAWQRTLALAPDARAIADAAEGREYSRRELWDAAQRAKQALPSRIRGRRVVFARPNGAAWFARFLALLDAGAVAVPVDPTESAERQHELAAEVGAAGVWSGDAFEPASPSRIVKDRTACLLKLTSGSTGHPRALRFTAAQLLADGRQVAASMDIRANDLNLAVIPCGHSYGLGNLVLPLLAQGIPMVVANSPLPRVLADTCQRWRPSIFPAIPALLKLLTESNIDAAALESLRTVISAGSRLAPEVAQAFYAKFGRMIHNFYGSSETGGISYDRGGEATLTGRSVGTPLDGVLLTMQTGGRFVVEGAAVYTLGNRNRAASGCGRHRPADRGRLSDAGELILQGRSGRLAKIAGRRIDLGEIEAILRQMDGVSDALASTHPSREDELAAAVETHLSDRDLRAMLASRLPAWKIPRRLLCLPQFPLTGRGKTDAAALSQRLARSP